MRHPLAVLPLLLATVAAACSSGSGTSDPASSTSTTIDPIVAAHAYEAAGPHPVGVVTLHLTKGPDVEVWYPAAEGTTGTISYDVRDFTPPAIRSILTGDVPASYGTPGARDATVADGAFPVVLFSHGFTGIRVQSTFLTAHLASWGMVVVAPEHPSRDLFNVLGGTASGDQADSVDDLLQSLTLITAEGTQAGGRFDGHIDARHVAAVGHSAGGGTILGAALDERVDGYVSMASGGPTAPAPYPDRPSFFLAGAVDAVVPAAKSTRPAFDGAPAPSRWWEIEGVGHNGFDDFCTFGGGKGIIGIAEQSGLGGFLDGQPRLRALGQDGCIPPAAPVVQSFPIIRHGVTAWLRSLFGQDPAPVGLDGAVETAYALKVTVASK